MGDESEWQLPDEPEVDPAWRAELEGRADAVRQKFEAEVGPSYTWSPDAGDSIQECRYCMRWIAVIEEVVPNWYAPFGIVIREFHSPECPVLGEWLALEDPDNHVRWIVALQSPTGEVESQSWPTWASAQKALKNKLNEHFAHGDRSVIGKARDLYFEEWREYEAIVKGAEPGEALTITVGEHRFGLLPQPSPKVVSDASTAHWTAVLSSTSPSDEVPS